MNLPQDLPRAPTAEHLQQLTASQNEAKQLRILISESKLHETEIRAALAEEQTLRSKLDREKQELLKRLAEKPATTDAASDRRLALLDTRVKELESERNELKQRLRRVSGRAMVRIDATRSRTATPRERAVEFRLVR